MNAKALLALIDECGMMLRRLDSVVLELAKEREARKVAEAAREQAERRADELRQQYDLHVMVTPERYAELEQAERRAERLKGLLRSLHALVWGECPSLLNEDSGGSSHLDSDIRAEFKGE